MELQETKMMEKTSLDVAHVEAPPFEAFDSSQEGDSRHFFPCLPVNHCPRASQTSITATLVTLDLVGIMYPY